MKDDPVPDPSEIYEAWRDRFRGGKGEPFEALVESHPGLRQALLSLHETEQWLERNCAELKAGLAFAERRRAPGAGDRIGDFRIVSELGRGGMGIVYEAEQISLHRRVAVKVLSYLNPGSSSGLTRFQREAEITGRLKHPGIVDVHQVGEQDGTHFIAMELVEGCSLDALIERFRDDRGPKAGAVLVETSLPESASRLLASAGDGDLITRHEYVRFCADLVARVADALQHAHEAGVIHRDIKPANVLVRRDGAPVLTDFGLAREVGLPAITLEGLCAGTPSYLAPEQAMAGRVPVDHRADLFALGATLYELLTLRRAFAGDSMAVVLAQILNKPPAAADKINPGLSRDLVTILDKSLEKDPDHRYASARALGDDLRAFLADRPIAARPTSTVVRAMRWARRERAKALLVGALAVALPASVLLGSRTLSAGRVIESTRAELESARLPARMDEAFLDLGLGQLERAETSFRELFASAPDAPEAAAGLAMSLLELERADEALAAIDAYEARDAGALGRLRVQALRDLGRNEEADRQQAALGPPESPRDRYLEAVRLISNRPFLAGLPEATLTGLQASRPVDARGDAATDSLLAVRRDARRAVELLETALLDAALLDENRAPYVFALAWASWAARDPDSARRSADSLARRWPEDPVPRFYAALAREVFDPEAALEAYAPLAEGPGGMAAARERRVALWIRAGEVERAVEEARKLVALDPDRVTSCITLGRALTRAGNFEEVAEVASALLGRDRAIVEANSLLGGARYYLGDLDGARESFEAAVALHPGRALYQRNLGWVLHLLHDDARAIDALWTACELDPTDALAAFNLGVVLEARGDREEAIEALLMAIDSEERHGSPDLPLASAFCVLSQAQFGIGGLADSAESARRAIEIDPGNQNAHFLLFQALFKLGDEAWLEAGERYLALRPPASSNYGLVVVELDQRGEDRRALELARIWTEVDEENPIAWMYRAWFRVDPEGDPELRNAVDGLACIQRALQLSEETPDLLDTLACAQYASGLVDEARETARRALDLAIGLDASGLESYRDRLEWLEAQR